MTTGRPTASLVEIVTLPLPMRSNPTVDRAAPSTKLSARTVCGIVQRQREAVNAPAPMPTVSPSTSDPYCSLGLVDPLAPQAARPASVPQAVVLVNQADCSRVGLNPKRESPQEVPKPITAPVVASRSCGVTPDRLSPPMSPRFRISAAPATVDAPIASGVPGIGPRGRGGGSGGALVASGAAAGGVGAGCARGKGSGLS